MAHLLGTKNCLESLARDVEDIQTTVKDALEKIGPLRTQSWKFPDRLASELDIDDLTDTYSHSKDEDFNRLAHIVLFELVIDRFVFLLQAVSEFLDQIVSNKSNLSASTNRPKSRTVGTTMSVGLVVKKFWSKAVQISHNIQQMKHEMKTKLQMIPKMEETIVTLREDNQLMRDAILSMRGKGSRMEERGKSVKTSMSNANFILSPSSSVSFTGEGDSNDVTLSVEDSALSKVLRHVSIQTLDTAFVPCEACSRMQQNLLDVGASVISLCESQGLPSALAKQKRLLKQSLMAAADVSRWTNEQTRDIERINKHLDNLYAQINPLKEDLDRSRANNRKLQEQIKELQKAKETAESEITRTENELSEKITKISRENSKNVEKMEFKIGELENGKKNLQKLCQSLKEENSLQESESGRLVKENKTMAANLEKEIAETTRLKEVEKEFHTMKEDLAFVRTKLYETEIELNKSQAENKAIAKHDKALQSKQEALLLRADQLDQECEELQNRIQEMEDEQERLKSEYEALKSAKALTDEELANMQKLAQETTAEKMSLQKLINELESNVSELRSEVEESREKLRFVSQFPVIGHEDLKDDGMNFSEMLATPNAVEEMANIIMANSTRIAILEEQNDQLRKALEGYEKFQQHKSTTIPKDRVPLWNSRDLGRAQQSSSKIFPQEGSSSTSKESPGRNRSKQSVKDSHFNLQNGYEAPTSPKPPSQPRTSNSKLNEKRHAFGIGATLANAGKPRKSRDNRYEENTSAASQLHMDITMTMGNIQSRTTKSSRDDYNWTETFSCPDCDKMYSSQRDLQIHKSFCYAKT